MAQIEENLRNIATNCGSTEGIFDGTERAENSRRRGRPYKDGREAVSQEMLLTIIRDYNTWNYDRNTLAERLGVTVNAIAYAWKKRAQILRRAGFKSLRDFVGENNEHYRYRRTGKVPWKVPDKNQEKSAKLAENGNVDDDLFGTVVIEDQLWLWTQTHRTADANEIYTQAHAIAEALGTGPVNKWTRGHFLKELAAASDSSGGDSGLGGYGPADIFNLQELSIHHENLEENVDKSMSTDSLLIVLCANAAGSKEPAVVVGRDETASISTPDGAVIFVPKSVALDPDDLVHTLIRKLNRKMAASNRHILLLVAARSPRRIRLLRDRFSNVKLVFFSPIRHKLLIGQPFTASLIMTFKLKYNRFLLEEFHRQFCGREKPEALQEFQCKLTMENMLKWISRSWQEISASYISTCFLRTLKPAGFATETRTSVMTEVVKIQKIIKGFSKEHGLQALIEDLLESALYPPEQE